MNNKVFSLFSRKTFPEQELVEFALTIFVISNFLGLVASIIFLASRFTLSAAQFLGITQGMGVVSGLGLLIVLIRMRLAIKNLFSSLTEAYPEYASIFLKFDETMFNIGISITAAGLVLNVFLPFGFLVALLGIVLGLHSLLRALKEHEENELKILQKILKREKVAEFFPDLVVDMNLFVLAFVTLCGYFLMHPVYFESIRKYLEDRSKLLTEVRR